MSCLNEFPEVSNNLKLSKRISIVALHKFIFEDEGDRNNRKRLREFSGFTYDEESVQYTDKTQYVTDNLTIPDLTSICHILGLGYDKADLTKYIFLKLKQNELLKNNEDNDGNTDEDDDEVETNNDNEVDEGDSDDIHQNNKDDDEGEGDVRSTSSISNYEYARSITNVSKRREQRSISTYNDVRQQSVSRFSLNFKDVEDSIRVYDGSGKISIQYWVKEFEEMAALMHWDELHKTIFAKKSLKGIAKMFILSEHGLTTWAKLKKALTDEFSEHTNSAKLHEMLTERRMQKEETMLEYLYAMKEIASKGNIEENALIQYIIDGIRDVNVNKTMLYGASNNKEFKKKLHDYKIYTIASTSNS